MQISYSAKGGSYNGRKHELRATNGRHCIYVRLKSRFYGSGVSVVDVSSMEGEMIASCITIRIRADLYSHESESAFKILAG